MYVDYIYLLFVPIFLVGNDWNLQFSGRLLISKYKFKKNKELFRRRSIAVMFLVHYF
jgi:hypothetical protein